MIVQMLKISNVSPSWYQKQKKQAQTMGCFTYSENQFWRNERRLSLQQMCVWSFITFIELCERFFQAIGRVRKYLRTTIDSPRMRKCENLPREAPFSDI